MNTFIALMSVFALAISVMASATPTPNSKPGQIRIRAHPQCLPFCLQQGMSPDDCVRLCNPEA
ncbi:hypothetical protein OC844_006803 [Tilletia horrida]|nr:hypothetical protein OC844_006803 [Tilletia horrida]